MQKSGQLTLLSSQSSRLGRTEPPPLTWFEVRRQAQGPITHSREPPDLETDCLPETPDLPVATLVQHHPKPGMRCTLPVGRFRLDGIESRRTVLELDAGTEPCEHRRGRLAPHAHQVLAFDLAPGVRQAMRERPIGREEQQARGVDVEPADCNPAPVTRCRQTLE